MKTPDHYTSAKTPIERLPEAYKEGFIIGNIIKYASRAGLKDSFEDDLNKCLHYCQMLMELRSSKVTNHSLSNRIKQFAELLQEPEPVYNQPQIVEHPEPKGEVPSLPKGAIIPDNGYLLGSKDVFKQYTDWFWVEHINQWVQIEGSQEPLVGTNIAYRIYK